VKKFLERIVIRISIKIEWFVASETFRPSKEISYEFVDNLSSYRHNSIAELPLSRYGKNSR